MEKISENFDGENNINEVSPIINLRDDIRQYIESIQFKVSGIDKEIEEAYKAYDEMLVSIKKGKDLDLSKGDEVQRADNLLSVGPRISIQDSIDKLDKQVRVEYDKRIDFCKKNSKKNELKDDISFVSRELNNLLDDLRNKLNTFNAKVAYYRSELNRMIIDNLIKNQYSDSVITLYQASLDNKMSFCKVETKTVPGHEGNRSDYTSHSGSIGADAYKENYIILDRWVERAMDNIRKTIDENTSNDQPTDISNLIKLEILKRQNEIDNTNLVKMENEGGVSETDMFLEENKEKYRALKEKILSEDLAYVKKDWKQFRSPLLAVNGWRKLSDEAIELYKKIKLANEKANDIKKQRIVQDKIDRKNKVKQHVSEITQKDPEPKVINKSINTDAWGGLDKLNL